MPHWTLNSTLVPLASRGNAVTRDVSRSQVAAFRFTPCKYGELFQLSNYTRSIANSVRKQKKIVFITRFKNSLRIYLIKLSIFCDDLVHGNKWHAYLTQGCPTKNLFTIQGRAFTPNILAQTNGHSFDQGEFIFRTNLAQKRKKNVEIKRRCIFI